MKKYVCKEVKAVFKPKRLDDLRPELLTCIGREFNFQYSWLMDENDTFPGVWALTATLPDFIKCWVPEFDLELVKS